jgi:membrane protease YdiL (CAAX protease family)
MEQAPARRAIAVEVLVAFAAVTAVVSGLYRLRTVAFIDRNLAVVAAVLFLYVPAMLLWRRKLDLEQYGMRISPLGRGLLLWALALAVVLPLFSIGYYLYMRKLCPHLPRALVYCPPALRPILRLPPQPLLAVVSQLVVVALPEEFFFRGFIQGRLAQAYTRSTALLATAAIFALGHYLVTFEPAALAVFFPGILFGLLRAATGSILAGTLFHASCNLLIDVLHRSVG